MASKTRLGFLGLPMRAIPAGEGGFPEFVYCFDADVESESNLRITGITSTKQFGGSVATESAMKGLVLIHE